jgi:hypothetical protein
LSGASESALERLSEEAARKFRHLLAARAETTEGLQDRRERLARLHHDDDVSVVLMGSWGRSEVTSGSDDDFMVLVDGPERDDVQPSIGEVETVLTAPPATKACSGFPSSATASSTTRCLRRDPTEASRARSDVSGKRDGRHHSLEDDPLLVHVAPEIEWRGSQQLIEGFSLLPAHDRVSIPALSGLGAWVGW